MPTNDTLIHYEEHLAAHYDWVFGGREHKLAENRAFFQRLGMRPELNGKALDLGAGTGFQTLPLEELGFAVDAVDFSASLLTQLEAHAAGRSVRVVCAELNDYVEHTDQQYELIVCMGDTLTHLHGLASVERLLRGTVGCLLPQGRLVLTFRDYSRELHGEQRFIPVRSDAERIWTCFLEYTVDTVVVHDLLHQRQSDGWQLSVSAYSKTRVSPEWMRAQLKELGCSDVAVSVEAGMATVNARK